MTMTGRSPMSAAMLRRGILMLCLLVTSLMVSSVVYAGEFTSAASIDCSGFVHSDADGDTDADQSQGDPDRAAQHHGTCHYAPATLVAPHFAVSAIMPRASPLPFGNEAGVVRRNPGPGLRPPIA